MIVGIGVDTVAIGRIERLLQRGGDRLLARLCRDDERRLVLARERPGAALAARFCAKEAVAKCLGTGFASGVAARDIEVVRATDGAVSVRLHGGAARRAESLGIRRVLLSLSHNEHSAVAFAIAEG
ncbi:MAG: holo-ACP synthase [Planctomycetota bacterium]